MFRIDVKRTLERDKEKVIKIFEKEFLPKFTEVVPFNEDTEPMYYALHIRSSKGRLFILSYYLQKQFGGDLKKAFVSSVAVEMLSAGTLILDDIFDRDEIRGGVDSVWKKYGIRKALCSLEYVKGMLYNKLLELDTRMYKTVKLAWDSVIEGFLMEEKIYLKKKVAMEDWSMLAKQFGSFGWACIKLAKLNSKIPKNLYKYLWDFNKYHTIAWVFDDPLEVFFEERSKKIYSDIKNGYYVLPVLLLIKKLDNEEKKRFEEIFGKEEYVKEVVELMNKYKIKEECSKIIEKLHDKAQKYFEKFWDPEYDENLKTILRAYTFLRSTKLKTKL